MNKFIYSVALLCVAPMVISCSETVEEVAQAQAIKFSISRAWPEGSATARSISPAVFGVGDKIGVFACYRPQTESGASDFNANFMCNQTVSYDGSNWSYSPIKYWPTNGSIEFCAYYPYNPIYDTCTNGALTIDYKCTTGVDPLFAAHADVKAENGLLTGDGVSENGRLQLGFEPLLNRINFTANADEGLFDEVDSDEYKDCRFLIKEFRVWGFYKVGRYEMANDKWQTTRTQYTRNAPLDMTGQLALQNTEEVIPGYVYAPDQGYCTDKAVVITEGEEQLNIFGKSTYFIPMNGVVSYNKPGFEIVYVVLTSKKGENSYRESGVVTRDGSLSEIFAGANGRIKKNIHVNLEFSIDGVTVTRNLEDYIYKPMF